MKILVIGGCGFIGSHAVKFFLKKGNRVAACDVVESPYPDIDFFRLDRSNPDFEKPFENNQYDICINASGSATVGYSFSDPLNDYTLNTFNVFKILNTIRKLNPTCRFINFSSAAVYGNPEQQPVKESHATKPLSPYGCHKLMAERICTEFFNIYKIQSCSLRVFSAYGPGLKKQLFWDIFQKIKNTGNSNEHGEIELFGTGNESRDFIFIDDLLAAIDIVLQKSNFDANVINVSSGVETTIREASALLVGMLNEKLKVKFNGTVKKGDPLNWNADISLLSSFGFSAETNIKTGVKKYSEWLRNNLQY